AILIDGGVLPNVHAFLIAPGEPAGPVPPTINGIPAVSTYVVIEVVDGGTDTVTIVGVGSGQGVTVGAASSERADLTNTFHPASIPRTTPMTTTTTPTSPTTTAPAPTTATKPGVLPATGNSDGPAT